MKNKTIYTIDMVLVGLGVVLLLGLIQYSRPMVLAPLNSTTYETNILFSIEDADKILIADNIDFNFSKEIIVRDKNKISLDPGFYYWKIISPVRSEIRTLNILSKIELSIRETKQGYNIINSGNTKLNVEVYDKNTKIETFELNNNENRIENGDKFIGVKNE